MKQKDLKVVKILCAFALPLLLLAPSPGLRVFQARCDRVLDGDTVEVTYGHQVLKLRLAYIDAPELSQQAFDKVPIGENSKVFLEELVLGKTIKVRVIQKDRYGRYLAQISLGRDDINLYMLEQGHALIYRYYEFESRDQRLSYMGAEMLAKRKRLGMWNTFGFYDPYAYRRLKRRKNAKH